MRTVWLVDMLSRISSSSRLAGLSSSRWNRIEVCRMRSTRSNTSAPSWSRTVSPRMRPSSRMSLRSRVSSSSAEASSARLVRTSVSEGMVWGDIVGSSRGCPAVSECASFLPQCKIKIEANGANRFAAGVSRRGAAFFTLLRRTGTHLRASKDRPRISSAPRRGAAQHPGHASLLNPPPRPFPIGIAQTALEDLAGILARQILLDFDGFRHLVVRARGLYMGADRADIERHPGLRLHHRHQRLAEFRVGDAEYGAVVHAGDRMQRGLDFGRIDVDAP